MPLQDKVEISIYNHKSNETNCFFTDVEFTLESLCDEGKRLIKSIYGLDHFELDIYSYAEDLSYINFCNDRDDKIIRVDYEKTKIQ